MSTLYAFQFLQCFTVAISIKFALRKSVVILSKGQAIQYVDFQINFGTGNYYFHFFTECIYLNKTIIKG